MRQQPFYLVLQSRFIRQKTPGTIFFFTSAAPENPQSSDLKKKVSSFPDRFGWGLYGNPSSNSKEYYPTPLKGNTYRVFKGKRDFSSLQEPFLLPSRSLHVFFLFLPSPGNTIQSFHFTEDKSPVKAADLCWFYRVRQFLFMCLLTVMK
ncbi:hypothetical protein XENORESO_007401 [Xenotaenia resolanae]|uniref:Uncharacterized protein n=1 Tax=Xenotaenia resolanae TaxID=208358 RepID=A0ABV0W4T2_9TELE